jgi:DNA mismatch repair protein MSH5
MPVSATASAASLVPPDWTLQFETADALH